jgi:hypothetical protein
LDEALGGALESAVSRVMGAWLGWGVELVEEGADGIGDSVGERNTELDISTCWKQRFSFIIFYRKKMT